MGRKKTRKNRTSKKSMNSVSKNTKRIMRIEKKADLTWMIFKGMLVKT